jgi:hypothetical protein
MELKMTTKFFLCMIAAWIVVSTSNTLAGSLTAQQSLCFGVGVIVATLIIKEGIRDDK